MFLHIAIMIAGDAVGLHYVVSSVVSLVIVTAVGYCLHSSWTYPRAERGAPSFARYVVLVGSNFPLSLTGLFVFVDLLGVSVPIAAPAVTVILVGFNYVASRWVFRGARRGA